MGSEKKIFRFELNISLMSLETERKKGKKIIKEKKASSDIVWSKQKFMTNAIKVSFDDAESAIKLCYLMTRHDKIFEKKRVNNQIPSILCIAWLDSSEGEFILRSQGNTSLWDVIKMDFNKMY